MFKMHYNELTANQQPGTTNIKTPKNAGSEIAVALSRKLGVYNYFAKI
jgi:hypothetical protein